MTIPRLSILASLLVFLTACASATPPLIAIPTQDTQVLATQIAANIFATLTASAPRATESPTATIVPSVTGTPANTPTPIRTMAPTPGIIVVDLQSAVLTIKDVPVGESQIFSGSVSNEDYAKSNTKPDELLGLLKEWGRVTGYRNIFQSAAFKLLSPNSGDISSEVSTFKTVAGAQTFIDQYQTFTIQPGFLIYPTSIPPVGDSAKAFTVPFVPKAGSEEWTGFLIVFRKSNIVAATYVSFATKTAILDIAISSAKIVESRIR